MFNLNKVQRYLLLDWSLSAAVFVLGEQLKRGWRPALVLSPRSTAAQLVGGQPRFGASGGCGWAQRCSAVLCPSKGHALPGPALLRLTRWAPCQAGMLPKKHTKLEWEKLRWWLAVTNTQVFSKQLLSFLNNWVSLWGFVQKGNI